MRITYLPFWMSPASVFHESMTYLKFKGYSLPVYALSDPALTTLTNKHAATAFFVRSFAATELCASHRKKKSHWHAANVVDVCE